MSREDMEMTETTKYLNEETAETLSSYQIESISFHTSLIPIRKCQYGWRKNRTDEWV